MLRTFKNFLHGYEAKAANLIYGYPTRKIATIGVTGTDGKTTTSSLIFHILKSAGAKAAMVTTVGAQILDEKFDTGLHTTTPSSFFLQRYVKKAVDAGCEYLVLEITSHALDQNRASGIDFKIGVLTNITHEHLDYHKTYNNYLATKAKLFKLSKTAIINKDDESFAALLKIVPPEKTLTYSINQSADFNLKNTGLSAPLEFDFNTQNFLAAIAVAKTLGIENEKIMAALPSFKFPEGRQEIVYDKEFKVIVDFAHTPNSFKSILPSLKKASNGRLIHVFGTAGERDRSKRPLMGKISSKISDIIVLTAEDPRHESIRDINKEIKLGVDKKFVNVNFKTQDFLPENDFIIEVDDRQEAINFAIKLARPGDTVIVTGKGHEKSLNLGHGEIAWSEHEAVTRALKNKNAS